MLCLGDAVDFAVHTMRLTMDESMELFIGGGYDLQLESGSPRA